MSRFEVLLFGAAVQWCAGAVLLINVVMSRLHRAYASTSGGE